MGRELEKSMQSQLKYVYIPFHKPMLTGLISNVTTLGVFYNSFDSDFNRTALASAETAAAVLVCLRTSMEDASLTWKIERQNWSLSRDQVRAVWIQLGMPYSSCSIAILLIQLLVGRYGFARYPA